MGSTTAIGAPYPVPTDTPDVPRDVKALADWLTLTTPRVAATAGALPTGMPAGTLCWQTDIARMMVYTGSAWELSRGYFAMAAGSAALAALNAGLGTTVSVTFPVGRFTQAPVLTASAETSGFTLAGSASTTTTGANIRAFNVGGSNAAAGNVKWWAVQMTSASATG